MATSPQYETGNRIPTRLGSCRIKKCFVHFKGSRRSDEEALEEQVRKLGEELRDLRELYQAGQDKAHSSEEEVLELHNQVRSTGSV